MIDLTKYVKEGVEVNNDDFNLDKLSKDILKGYVKESEATKGMVSKEDYTKLQNDYTSLEDNYNNTIKTLGDTNDKLSRISLENVMVKKGFKDSDFDEVAKLRTSLYGDVKDDTEAINSIADRYKNTFFEIKQESVYTPAPNEGNLNGGKKGEEVKKVEITRKTSIKDLLIPKN